MTTCAPPADSDLDPVPTGVDPTASTGSHHRPDATGPTSRLPRRFWPAVASIAVMVTGVGYMLAWGPLVLHRPIWMTGGDLWGIFRGAHYIAWGYLPGVYASANGVVAFPGMEVLLAPVAMVTSALHLTESYGPFFVPRPTAALVVQPVELLTAGAVTFAVDALAERLRVARPRRIVLCFAAAALAWPVAAVWGHGEDLLALTFGIYALIAAIDGRWRRAGWLLGLGIAFQPLVALIVPLLIGASPRGQRLMLAVRSAALSAFLVGVAFVGDPADTLRAVVTQPTPPSVNHATPWVAFAPTVSSGATGGGSILSVVRHGNRLALHTAQTTIGRLEVVSGGAGRTIDVVLALLFGLYAWRRPQEPVRLLWLATVVLASRCFFEAVMTPYYLAPPLILALALAALRDRRRFVAAVVLAGEVTVFAYHRLSPWAWWLPVVAGLVAVVALAVPPSVAGSAGAADGAASEADRAAAAGPIRSSPPEVPVLAAVGGTPGSGPPG